MMSANVCCWQTLSGHGATQNSGLPRSTSCASNTPDSHAAMWYASTWI